MGAMRIPGFSGDASLYWSSTNYRGHLLPSGLRRTEGGTIRPALRNGCECYKSMGGPACICHIRLSKLRNCLV